MRRRSRRPSGPRRKFQWLGSLSADALTTLIVPTVGGTSDFAAAWIRPPAGTVDSISGEIIEVDWTLIREINVAGINILNNNAGTLNAAFGMGVIAWDGISDTLPPPLETPLPIQNPMFDWLWWWTVSPGGQVHPAGGQIYFTNQGNDGMMFGKSARKLSQGTGLLLVVECFATFNNVAGNTWSWTHMTRYGYKLP